MLNTKVRIIHQKIQKWTSLCLTDQLTELGETKKNSRFPGNHCRELVRAGEFFLFFFENLMLDCMHKFRARSHKISTPCIISTPSSRYGFSHDLLVFFFDVHVENTGMTLAFRLAWSVLCCGHENRVRTRVTRGSGQPKKKKSRGGIFWCARARESRIFFGLALAEK